MHKFQTRFGIRCLVVTSLLFLSSSGVVHASGSLSMSTIAPSDSVPAGTTVSFVITPSGFSSPSYTVDDNFGGTTLTNSNINSSGNFSWTPSSKDIGTHSFAISASDASGNAANLSVTLTVRQPIITLSEASPSATVMVGSGVSFSATVIGLPNASFRVSDASGGSLSNSNISSSGFFSWIPAVGDIGTHSVTITAEDSYGHSVSTTKELTVTGAPTLSITSLSPPGGIGSPGIPLTFTVTQTGMTSPTYSVTDSYVPTTVTSANISSGSFSWIPTLNETGTHRLFVIVTDSSTGKTLSIAQPVTVVIPSISILGGREEIAPGSKLSFIVNTNNFMNPAYSVSDSFSGGTVADSNINTSGYFEWTPSANDRGEHTFTVKVSDSYGRSGTASIHVRVKDAPVGSGSSTQTVTGLYVINSLSSKSVTSAPQTSRFKFSKPLSYGMRGSEVQALQQRLKELGFFSGEITLYFGVMTKEAVKRFQAKNGIPQLGNVGPQTRATLNKS